MIGGHESPANVDVLCGCFGQRIDGPGLPCGLLYQGNPSISPQKDTCGSWFISLSHDDSSIRPMSAYALLPASRGKGLYSKPLAPLALAPDGGIPVR